LEEENKRNSRESLNPAHELETEFDMNSNNSDTESNSASPKNSDISKNETK
jgi:hypothetical protein